MSKKNSAGILLFNLKNDSPYVFLVHPGGPFWAKKDKESWSIPKGKFEDNENPLETAKREFTEETGFQIPNGEFIELEPLKQPSKKVIYAWALKGDVDADAIKSNSFEMEWPPKSGRKEEFPEIDRASWFNFNEARVKLHKGQVPFISQLEKLLGIKTVIDNSKDLNLRKDPQIT